jgi:hypothetical protein
MCWLGQSWLTKEKCAPEMLFYLVVRSCASLVQPIKLIFYSMNHAGVGVGKGTKKPLTKGRDVRIGELEWRSFLMPVVWSWTGSCCWGVPGTKKKWCRRTSISGTTFSGKKCLSGTIFHAIWLDFSMLFDNLQRGKVSKREGYLRFFLSRLSKFSCR